MCILRASVDPHCYPYKLFIYGVHRIMERVFTELEPGNKNNRKDKSKKIYSQPNKCQ